MAFEKKEGQGSLFHNEAQTDRHPVLKGYVVYKGEEISLALWAGKEGSKVAFSVKAEAKRERREDGPPRDGSPALVSYADGHAEVRTVSQRATPKRDPISSGRNADMDDEIPF